MQWSFKSTQLANDTTDLLNIVLQNRGVLDNVDEFLNPVHPNLISLDQAKIKISEIKKLAKILQKIKREKKKILIFGDYDVDGVCATGLLWEFLFYNGFEVVPFLPHRKKHGYGLSLIALEEIFSDKKNKPDLIITVDNGVVAHEALQFAHDNGVEVVVTDHHESDDRKLPVLALIHTTKICATGLVFFLIRELSKLLKISVNIEKMLDLTALATIADMMPLFDINRSLAFYGIKSLQDTNRVGLQQLMKLNNIEPKTIDSAKISFQLAPSINSAGRIDDPMMALRLVCSQDPDLAKSRASHLSILNSQRQSHMSKALELSFEQAKQQLDQVLLAIYLPEIEEGVVGLVAGKLTEAFKRPAMVFTQGFESSSQTKIIKGSARSVDGLDITALLRTYLDDFLSVGGHRLASGFSFKLEKLETLIENLQQQASSILSIDNLDSKLKIDCYIDPSLVVENTYIELQKLEPFGLGNPRPVFCLQADQILEVKYMGDKNQHARLKLKSKDFIINAVYWRYPENFDFKHFLDRPLQLAVNVDLNHWQNRSYPQVLIKDLGVGED